MQPTVAWLGLDAHAKFSMLAWMDDQGNRRQHWRFPTSEPQLVIDPELVKAQPEQWRCIGQEVNEQLDYEPDRFLRRRVIRRKYVHRAERDHAPLIAPLPDCLQERGLAAPGLLAHMLVSKYCDHLPLYRQEKIYRERHGVNLTRQTMNGWVEAAADWLGPIYREMKAGLVAQDYLQADETPIRYLDPDVKGKSQSGWARTFAATRRRTRPSSIITSTCRSISRKSPSSPRPM